MQLAVMRSPRMRARPGASASCLLRRRQFKCKSYKHRAKRAVQYWCVGWGTNHAHKLTQTLHNISFFYNWLSAAASIYDRGFRQLRSSRACSLRIAEHRSARYNYIAPTPRPARLYWRTDFILSYSRVYFVRFIFEPKRRVLTFRRAGGGESVACAEVRLGKFYITAIDQRH